jgi:hypothetical protein
MRCKPIIAVVAICAVLLACESKGPVSLPTGMFGVWKTSEPRYEGCFFELRKDKITFANKAFAESFMIHKVSKVEIKTPITEKLLCTVYYEGTEGQEMQFTFYYDPADGGSIRFKNQADINWKKAEWPSIKKMLENPG